MGRREEVGRKEGEGGENWGEGRGGHRVCESDIPSTAFSSGVQWTQPGPQSALEMTYLVPPR